MTNLTSLSIAVTGAGAGIGATLARAYGTAGASVLVSDRDLDAATRVAAEIVAAGGVALAVEMDVTDRAAVRTGLARARDRFGRLDVLVANAGISFSTDIHTTTEDDWMRHQRVNGLGTLITMQEAANIMIEAGTPGKIIVLTSVAGRRNNPDWVAYAASKATTSSLIQGASRALAPHRITVTGIAPGIVETPLWAGIDDTAEAHERRFARFAAAIPLGRVSQPDDLIGVGLFLAGPASDYMTGQTVTVDGGLTA